MIIYLGNINYFFSNFVYYFIYKKHYHKLLINFKKYLQYIDIEILTYYQFILLI